MKPYVEEALDRHPRMREAMSHLNDENKQLLIDRIEEGASVPWLATILRLAGAKIGYTTVKDFRRTLTQTKVKV